jgi:phage protein D
MSAQAILPIDPYTGQDFYVPSFKVIIRDQELGPQVISDVMSVTYNETLAEIDSCDMAVNNWTPERSSGNASPASGSFKYSDGGAFDPWQDIEVWMGYYRNGQDERRRMLVGEITTMTPNFPASGASTLTVRALNLLHRFRIKQITKNYLKKKDSEIFRALVDEIGAQIRTTIPRLTLQVDDDEISRNLANEKEIPSLALQNEFPIVYLMQRARTIGYELFMEEVAQGKQRLVTFHFRPPIYVKRPTYILEWGKTLMNFQPSYQTANQVDTVIVRGWDPQRKQAFESKVTRADMLAEGVLDPTTDMKTQRPNNSDRTEVVVDNTVQTQAEAQVTAQKRMRQIAQGLVEGKGQTIGLPDLRAGCKLQIKGLGRFSGLYMVSATTHTLGDSGYTTSFTARMEQKQ